MNLEDELEEEIEKHERLKAEEKKRHNKVVEDIIEKSNIDLVKKKKEKIKNINDNISNNTISFKNDFYTILNKYLKGDDDREVINKSVTIRDGSIYKYRSSKEISFKYLNFYLDDFVEENPNGLVSNIKKDIRDLCNIERGKNIGESLSKYIYEGKEYYIRLSYSIDSIYIRKAKIDENNDKEDINFDKIKINFDSNYTNLKKHLKKYLLAEEDIIRAFEEYEKEHLKIKRKQEKKIQNIREECNEEMAYVTLTKI